MTALIAYWTVVCRVPRRLVEAMLADVWSLEMSLGSTQKAWEEVSQAVERPCQQLQEQLPHQAVLHVDERLAHQRRQAVDLGVRGEAIRLLCGGLHPEC